MEIHNSQFTIHNSQFFFVAIKFERKTEKAKPALRRAPSRLSRVRATARLRIRLGVGSQFTIHNLQIKQRTPTWGAFFVSLKATFNQKSRPPFRVVGLLSEWAVVSEKPLRVLPAKQLSVGVPNVSQRLPPPRGLLHHIRLTKRAVPKAPTRSSTPRSYYRDSRAYRRGTPRLR